MEELEVVEDGGVERVRRGVPFAQGEWGELVDDAGALQDLLDVAAALRRAAAAAGGIWYGGGEYFVEGQLLVRPARVTR